ncbi:hypothetical protein AC249_AIPGENE18820 [Exaiptasia diaphana]|nr:hypothetical protein AC249_AIPGENE18820 [Exaiptasia diaphana]
MPETNDPQISVPSNFPVPTPMMCRGDQVGNWEFFLQQWRDYEIATGLDKRSEKIRLATFRSVMGRECTSTKDVQPRKKPSQQQCQCQQCQQVNNDAPPVVNPLKQENQEVRKPEPQKTRTRDVKLPAKYKDFVM